MGKAGRKNKNYSSEYFYKKQNVKNYLLRLAIDKASYADFFIRFFSKKVLTNTSQCDIMHISKCDTSHL